MLLFVLAIVGIFVIVFGSIMIYKELSSRWENRKNGNFQAPGTYTDTQQFSGGWEEMGTQNEFPQNYADTGLTAREYAKQQKLENQLRDLEIKQRKQEIKDQKKQARCPKCGSTSLSANKKGFGVGKAVLGAGLTMNPLGLIAGNINAKKVWVTCLNCGKRWKM